ncbi:MAG: heavy-metal-associated domain-containing protein [Anaerolineae bacterium]|nr:heavy-metal-associated domain-containing protein [Anaerolineae bacterium]
MESRTVKVPNVGCAGCVNTIKSEVSDITGVVAVEGNHETKMVTIQWESPADWSAITEKMTGIDYAPES